MTSRYDELLRAARMSGGQAAEVIDELGQWAGRIFAEMKTDLANVALSEPQIVQGLLDAKFQESGFPHISIWRNEKLDVKALAQSDLDMKLAGAVLGKNPTAAFQVSVIYTPEGLHVYYVRVPNRGKTSG